MYLPGIDKESQTFVNDTEIVIFQPSCARAITWSDDMKSTPESYIHS